MRKNSLKYLIGVVVIALVLSFTIIICLGQEKPISIILTCTSVPPSPSASLGVVFKDALELLAIKPVEVNFYPSSQLGSAMQQLDGVLAGEIQMMYEDIGFIESTLPEIQVFSMPYLLKQPKDFQKIFKSEVGKKIIDTLRERAGLEIIGIAGRVGRQLTSNKPIYTPKDLKGFKIRVPDFSTYIDIWRTLGASPTPMSWNEVYTGLSLGTIDGQENPASVFFSNKLYEVQKYCTLTNHLISSSCIIANAKWFSSLDLDTQRAIYEAADLACNYITELDILREKVVLGILEKKGMKVINPDLQLWKETTKDMYKKYNTFSSDLYNEIEKICYE